MGLIADFIGTLRTSFRIGRATFDSSGLTAARTLSLPNAAGTVALDTLLADSGFSAWFPITGAATTPTAIGNAALTATGTLTAAAYATTSLHTRGRRVDYLAGVAATTAVAGFRSAANWRTLEGFHHVFRVSPATGGTVATRRFFVGVVASVAAPTDVQPSTLLDMAGVGYDAADATWQVMTNNNAGAAAKVSTGITRPATDRPGIYKVQVIAAAGGASVRVLITDEETGTTFDSGSITAKIPTPATALCCKGYHSVGGTNSVTGLTFFGGFIRPFS